ncbi:MAG: hypothetical protein IH598_09485 [Bacteroidales bacterium]|nr:hypothetical protein [Bacteroidales bacterium]
MKKILFPFLFVALAFQLNSCIDDETNPDGDPREAFLGTWVVDESCVRLNYEVEIEAAAGNDTKVLLYNFALTGEDYPPAEGYVTGSTINIPEQTIGDNWKIDGYGTLQSNGKILWSYSLEIAGDSSNCEAEYSK